MKELPSWLAQASNKLDPHRPPWIVKEDRSRTKRFIHPKMNGIHVDIVTCPPMYRAPILVIVSDIAVEA